MKKLKYLLIVIIVVVITILSLALIVNHNVNSEIKKMTPIESGEIVPNIYSIKDDFVNLYLIKSEDKFIAIDAGTNSEIVQNELKNLKIDPAKVAAVFLTHTDGDHVGALELFNKAKVYISKDEEQMINGEKSRFLFFNNKLDAKYNLLYDGQAIKIAALTVKCISTPGHTPGAMSFIVNDKYLFSGDTLSLINGKVELFNEYFNMDIKTQQSSIEKLRRIKDIKYIFSGHYGFSDNAAEAFKK